MTYGYDATGPASDASPSFWGVGVYPSDYYRPYVGDLPQKPIDYRPFSPPIFTYDPEPVVEPKKSPLERIADALEALVEQGKASATPQTYVTWNGATLPFDYSAEEEPELPETLTVGADDAVFVAAEDYWDQTPEMHAREGWEAGMLKEADGRYPAGLPRNSDLTQQGYFYQISNAGLEILGIDRR